MRDIKVKDKVKLRIPTGAEAIGVVQDIEPNGVLVIEVTVQSTSRYRRSPELVELADENWSVAAALPHLGGGKL